MSSIPGTSFITIIRPIMTGKRLPLLAWIAVLLCVAGCVKTDPTPNPGPTPPAPPVPVDAVTVIDYPYGPDPKMKMDLYLPGGRSTASTRTLVLIHGGGWTFGDKADLNPYIDSFKKVLPGWAIININYPLIDIATGAHHYPAQTGYIRRAMDTVKKNMTAWLISDKFGMWGSSAGANLALMHSYTQNTDGLVKAVGNHMGPTDLRDCWVNPAGPDTRITVINYTGILIPNIFQADAYDWGSPAYMLTNNAPPTITFHGTNDILVGISQARLLKDKLILKNIPYEHYEYTGLGHDIWPPEKLSDMFTKLGIFMTARVH